MGKANDSRLHLVAVRAHEHNRRRRRVAPPARVDGDGPEPEADKAQRLFAAGPGEEQLHTEQRGLYCGASAFSQHISPRGSDRNA